MMCPKCMTPLETIRPGLWRCPTCDSYQAGKNPSFESFDDFIEREHPDDYAHRIDYAIPLRRVIQWIESIF